MNKRRNGENDIRLLCRPIAEASPIPTAAVEGMGHVVRYVNAAFCRSVRKQEPDLIGKPFGEAVRTGEQCLSLLDRVYRTGQAETHIQEENSDSQSLFWSYIMSPLLNADQQPAAIVIEVIEMTSLHQERIAINEALMTTSVRQHAEILRNQEDLRALWARLVHVQEANMRELSRELHDDLSQQLAALSMEMSNVLGSSTEPSQPGNERVCALWRHIERLATGVHSISHRLHPAILEELGLAAALEEECISFSERTGVPVQFHSEGLRPPFAKQISLCFYRVAQESLQNIVKHAHAMNVRVTLSCNGVACRLRIEDDGQGFTPHNVRGRNALGLISMQERMRLINGEFTIASEPGRGTRLEVSAPLDTISPDSQ
jgi:signal transduction histidine kinase